MNDDELSFRGRLVALLDGYACAPRGSSDALLAAYVRACLSSRDALEMRVAREARRMNGSHGDPGSHYGGTPSVMVHAPVSQTPMFAGDPRPEVTGLLARWLLARWARTRPAPTEDAREVVRERAGR